MEEIWMRLHRWVLIQESKQVRSFLAKRCDGRSCLIGDRVAAPALLDGGKHRRDS